MAVNYSEAAILGRCANGIAGTVNFINKRLIGVGVPSTIDSLTKVNTLTNKGYTFAANVEKSIRSFGSTKTGSMLGAFADVDDPTLLFIGGFL